MKNVTVSKPEIYANSTQLKFTCAEKSTHEAKLASKVQDLAKNLFLASNLSGTFTFKATAKGVKIIQHGSTRTLEASQDVAKKILKASQKIWNKHTEKHLNQNIDSEGDSFPGSVSSSTASSPRTKSPSSSSRKNPLPKNSPLASPRSISTSSLNSSREPSSSRVRNGVDSEELPRRCAPLAAAQEAQPSIATHTEQKISEQARTIAELTKRKDTLEKLLRETQRKHAQDKTLDRKAEQALSEELTVRTNKPAIPAWPQPSNPELVKSDAFVKFSANPALESFEEPSRSTPNPPIRGSGAPGTPLLEAPAEITANKLAQLQLTLANLSSENKTLAEEKQELSKTLILMEERIRSFQQTIKDLDQSQEQDLHRSKAETAKLATEKKDLAGKVEENEATISALNRKCLTLENQEKRLQSKIETQTRELKALKEKHEQEVSLLNQKFDQLSTNLEETTKSSEEAVRKLRIEKFEAESNLEDLQAELQKQTEAAKQALANLKLQKGRSQQEMTVLQSQLESQSKTHLAILQEREKDIRNLNAQIFQQEQRIRLAEQEPKEAIAQLQQLNTQMEKRIKLLNTTSQAEKNELAQADKRNQELREKMRGLKITHRAQQQQLQAKIDEFTRLSAEQRRESLTLSQKIAQIETEKRQAAEESHTAIEALQKQIRSLENRNKTLESQLETQATETETVERNKRRLTRRLNTLKQSKKTLGESLSISQATILPPQKRTVSPLDPTSLSDATEKETEKTVKTVDSDKKKKQLERREKTQLNKTISNLEEQLKEIETQAPTLLTGPTSPLRRSNSTPDLSKKQDES